MSEDERTEAQRSFDGSLAEVIEEARAKAVVAERARAAKLLDLARIEAATRADYSAAATFQETRDAILESELQTQAPEPAPEPMTVAKVIGKLTSHYVGTIGYWEDVEADLQALVKEQARTDAALVKKCAFMTCVEISREIKKVAGLE